MIQEISPIWKSLDHRKQTIFSVLDDLCWGRATNFQSPLVPVCILYQQANRSAQHSVPGPLWLLTMPGELTWLMVATIFRYLQIQLTLRHPVNTPCQSQTNMKEWGGSWEEGGGERRMKENNGCQRRISLTSPSFAPIGGRRGKREKEDSHKS